MFHLLVEFSQKCRPDVIIPNVLLRCETLTVWLFWQFKLWFISPDCLLLFSAKKQWQHHPPIIKTSTLIYQCDLTFECEYYSRSDELWQRGYRGDVFNKGLDSTLSFPLITGCSLVYNGSLTSSMSFGQKVDPACLVSYRGFPLSV